MKDDKAEQRALLTIEDACERLSIGRSHLYDYLMDGSIRSIKLGKSRRIPAAALDEFIHRRIQQAQEEM
jgi:excisionase family DNA binding protein